LTWELRWGDQAEQLRAIAEETGRLPPALRDEPEVFEDMLWVWDAFWVLHRSRPIGWSVGPIPISEIDAYVRLSGVRRKWFLVRAVDSLDRVYLADHHERQAAKPAKTTAPKAPKRGRR
jgi:hypothetical protein